MTKRALCVALVCGVLGVSLQSGPTAQVSVPSAVADDLRRLAVPAAALPANCRPRSPGGMFTTNPAVVSDPVVLGFMHALVFGKLPGDDAAFGRGSPGDLKKLGPTIIAARAVNVEAGYASAYEEEGGSPEIGVFALRMKQISDEERSGLSHPPGKGIIKGPVAIYYWSDARADAPDRGCLDVVRQHIESLEFR